MKFSFNMVTEVAREELGKLGVKCVKEDSMWSILTEAYDVKEQEWRDHRPGYESRESIPQELNKEYSAQGTRIWKHPESGSYFYLIQDVVFVKKDRITLDYRTVPPTQNVVSVFDYIYGADDQAYYRDILIQRPPNADSSAGGVLI